MTSTKSYASLINDAGAERFPRSLSIKPNEVVLFRRELQDGVFDFFNQYTDDAIQITSRAVDLVFPDSLYREGVAG